MFTLWHSYAASINGYEDVEFPRLLGVYLTRADATAAQRRASQQQGFDGRIPGPYETTGLTIEEYTLGAIAWRGGFFSIDNEGREE